MGMSVTPGIGSRSMCRPPTQENREHLSSVVRTETVLTLWLKHTSTA
jgi:hypothetical protein